MSPQAKKARRRRSTTYWILREDQIECLASSRRQSILDRLCVDGPSSVREFSRAIGLKPSAAYHHLERLIEAELVEEAGERPVGRRIEKLYQAVAPRMRMARALADPDLAEPLRQVVSAMCRQLDRDFAVGIEHPAARPTGATRNLGFSRTVGTPDTETMKQINQRLAEIQELFWREPRRGAELVSFGWTLAPVPRPPGDGTA